MKLAGMDSCPSGWVVVLHDKGGFSFEVVSSIRDLVKLHPNMDRIYIDIPVGLSSQSFTRTIEKTMRQTLKSRSSTIFSPACREAIYASDYDKARTINKTILGKSISIQSYNISKKIKEVDQFMTIKSNDLELYESHPEICFKHLNNSEVIQTKKSTKDGFEERFLLLTHQHPQLESVYKNITKSFPKSKVKPDDILDAMVLCVCNLNTSTNPMHCLEDKNHTDALGIRIKIAY